MKNTDKHIDEGQKLKNIRKELNLTQEEFAKELDTTQAAIAMIEKGQRAVNSNIKYNLLQKMGLTGIPVFYPEIIC